MKILCKYRGIVFISASFLLVITTLDAQNIYPPFDANRVIEKVRYNHHSVRLRQGEFLIDTNYVLIGASERQYYPSVAFDGTNYLVVWEDHRNDPGSSDIYGARVDTSGTILDQIGIAISTATGSQLFPSVAFDGMNYLIVWHDDRSGSYDIYGARVSTSGVVLDPAGLIISDAYGTQTFPSLAFDGTNYLAVWQDTRSDPDYDIYGTRVATSGTVLDPAGISISTASIGQRYPSVAFDGTNYLVAWQDYRSGTSEDIYGTRVSTSGTVLDPAGIAISTVVNNEINPTIAFDGTNYMVVWVDYRNGSYSDIYGTRISQSGIVLDTTGIAISTALRDQNDLSITFGGSNFFVVWTDFRTSTYDYHIYGTRISTSGVVLDPDGIAISTADDVQSHPSLAFDGINYLAVWTQDRYGSYQPDVCCSRIDTSGAVLDTSGILISTDVYWYEQDVPSLIFGNSHYLIVWLDMRNYEYLINPSDIYGARVNETGVVLDATGIAISIAMNSQTAPSVAFDGTNYLVVWADCRNEPWIPDIYGARVDTSGTVLELNGITISTAVNDQTKPSVTFDGTNYLVVWEDKRNDSWDIYGTRVSSSGTVLDPAGIAISTATNSQQCSSIDFGGTNYLVVWEDKRSGSWDIYGTRVSPSGTILDPTGIPISTTAYDQRSPSIDFDGTNYLVVWHDDRNIPYTDIYGTRVTPSGIVIDPSGFAISTGLYFQGFPSVTFDGTNYLVIWQDERGGSYNDIYGAQVTPSGTIIDSFAVSLQPGYQFNPTSARGYGDQMLIAYNGWTDSINGHPTNIMRIWGKFYPFVGIDEDAELKTQASQFGLWVCPNPIYKTFNIKYTLFKETKVNLSLFDVTGSLVKEIVNRYHNAGSYQESFDGTDLTQGVYFLQLNTGDHSETKKVIYIK